MRRGRLKPRTIQTLRGEAHFARTAYECPSCRHTLAPLGREMDVFPHERMTRRVIRKVASEVARASFPEAEKHLLEQNALAVSASECRRVSLQYGGKLDQLRRSREAAWTAPWGEPERPAPPERRPERLRTVMIQDYRHVCEHLADSAKLLHPRDGEASTKLAEPFKGLLWNGEVDEIIARLRTAAKKLRGGRRQDLDRAIGYLEHGRERMDYPRYRAEGRLVGSGAVEGMRRHLVKERFNATGARWERANIPWALALRLSIFNGEWAEDWIRLRQAA